ncbi:uncharacterized protein LOC135394698 [Ornithodoros turicata]|uniref:Putative phosphatidylinositol transfer protein pdr16 n=1 Tax=Ornithodoros turicata TaxID=34597 RepID=A0A2R5L3V9_9ACAR
MAAPELTPAPVSQEDFDELKKRLQMIFDADPEQFHNDYSITRFLRAFRTIDNAFQAILKCNKWRSEYGVKKISPDQPDIKKNLESKKAMVLGNRDFCGRPVVYIPACKHNVQDRDIDELTRFIVYILEEACKKCFEEVIDNLCIIFDLKDFGLNSMDYPLIKNLIWLLSKHYPERLGVCLVINSPSIFSGCWVVIRGWLDDVTARKVVFINSQEELVKYIHPDILPNL